MKDNNKKFDRFIKLINKSSFNKLSKKKVLVLGLGGVGGYVVESLVRSGISSIIIVDYDKVELSNFNRQIIAIEDNLNRLKTDAFKDRIKSINSECEVICINKFIDENNYLELFDYDIDYFIDCCDSIKTKKLVVEKCLGDDIPIISSMGTGNRMDPSKLEIVDIRKTSYDPIAREIRKFIRELKTNKKLMVLCSREIPIKSRDVVYSNSFVPSSAGLLITSYVVNDIIKKED